MAATAGASVGFSAVVDSVTEGSGGSGGGASTSSVGSAGTGTGSGNSASKKSSLVDYDSDEEDDVDEEEVSTGLFRRVQKNWRYYFILGCYHMRPFFSRSHRGSTGGLIQKN